MYNIDLDGASIMPFLHDGFTSAPPPHMQTASLGAVVSAASNVPVPQPSLAAVENIASVPDKTKPSHALLYTVVGVVGVGIVIYLITKKQEDIRQQQAQQKLQQLKHQTKKNIQRVEAIQRPTSKTLCFRDLHL